MQARLYSNPTAPVPLLLRVLGQAHFYANNSHLSPNNAWIFLSLSIGGIFTHDSEGGLLGTLRWILSGLILLFVFSLLGCSGNHIRPEYPLSGYNTSLILNDTSYADLNHIEAYDISKIVKITGSEIVR